MYSILYTNSTISKENFYILHAFNETFAIHFRISENKYAFQSLKLFVIIFIGWKRGKSSKGQRKSDSHACKKRQTSRKISKVERSICRLDCLVSTIWTILLLYLSRFFQVRVTCFPGKTGKNWEKLGLELSVWVNLFTREIDAQGEQLCKTSFLND